jgi:hypothetical protein
MDKRHILDEIVRTAIQNGGIPLGKARFLTETGIKDADWSGKYWARWGDAVIEAGFVPNKLTQPIDESFLIQSYIELIRELGRIPVVTELRMKARQTSGFPNDKTFRERFGSKSQRNQKLVEYCESKPDFADVLAILRSSQFDVIEPSVDDDEPIEIKSGFVYLLKVSRHYKIGRSNSFERRSRELSIQLPEKAETVHVIKTDDPIGIELYWHRRFESKLKNGEWFELNALDVIAFKRRKFM